MAQNPAEFDRQMSFSQVDQDASGTIELEEMQTALPQIPSEEVAQIFAEADVNKDGHLDREEYSNFLSRLRNRTSDFAEVIVLPKRERTASRRSRQISQGCGETEPPAKVEKKFPFFIVGISILQWTVFNYLMFDTVMWLLIFHPLKRYEMWRFLTNMLIHSSQSHLWGNLVMQLILGSLLEVIHHWKRVGILYLGGVLFGTLAGSVFTPWAFLEGASDGVYCLLVGHLATIILNWNEMGCALCRSLLLIAYIAFDTWLVISEFLEGTESDTSHASHFGGALAGLVIGVNVLKNFEQRPWEIKLQQICRYIGIAFVVVCLLANLAFQIFYWASDPEDFEFVFNTTQSLNDTELDYE